MTKEELLNKCLKETENIFEKYENDEEKLFEELDRQNWELEVPEEYSSKDIRDLFDALARKTCELYDKREHAQGRLTDKDRTDAKELLVAEATKLGGNDYYPLPGTKEVDWTKVYVKRSRKGDTDWTKAYVWQEDLQTTLLKHLYNTSEIEARKIIEFVLSCRKPYEEVYAMVLDEQIDEDMVSIAKIHKHIKKHQDAFLKLVPEAIRDLYQEFSIDYNGFQDELKRLTAHMTYEQTCEFINNNKRLFEQAFSSKAKYNAAKAA